MHGDQNTCLNAFHTLRKDAHALVHARLCNSAFTWAKKGGQTSCSCPTLHILCTTCPSPWQLCHNCNYHEHVDCLVHVTQSQRSINSSISRPEESLWFCYVAGSSGSLSGQVALKCERLSVCPWLLWGGYLFFGFFFPFLKKRQVVLWFARSREVEDFAVSGTQYPRNLSITQGPHL